MTNHKEGAARGKSEQQLKGAQRLASKLQRALTTGHVASSEMREVDEHLSRNLTTLLANSLQALDTLANRSRDLQTREKLGALYVQTMGVFNTLKSLETVGYTQLVTGRDTVDPVLLNQLIDLDSELSSLVMTFGDLVARLARRSLVTEADHVDAMTLTKEILVQVRRRRALTLGSRDRGP